MASAKNQLTESPEKNYDSKALKSEILELKNRINQFETQISTASKKHHIIEREKKKLQIKLFKFQSTNNHLVDEINSLISRTAASVDFKGTCDETCPEFRLCAKRILIVGGITKMKSFYRSIVESSGGEFDYHDGYMKNGNKNLKDRVCKSDLILCPVNCNSHGACSQIKKLCKKYNKPVKMLSSSSLSSVSNALIESFKIPN